MFGQKNDTNSIPMLRKWQEFEGGNAEWNPLNTKEDWTDATEYNSVGVKNYRTQEDGINATVATLHNGHYSGICTALANDSPMEVWTREPIPTEIDTWGTHGLANWLRSLTPKPIPNPLPHKGKIMYVVNGPGNAGVYLLYQDGTMIPVGSPVTADSAALVAPRFTVSDSESWNAMIAKSNRVNVTAPAPVGPPTVP